jgi:proline dehydrogenase
MGALFAYSVEVDESEAMAADTHHTGGNSQKQLVDEMIRCINIAADFEDDIVGKEAAAGRRTWVAVKMVCLWFTQLYTR